MYFRELKPPDYLNFVHFIVCKYLKLPVDYLIILLFSYMYVYNSFISNSETAHESPALLCSKPNMLTVIDLEFKWVYRALDRKVQT